MRWELAKLHDEVSTWGSGTEVLAQDSRRKERRIADLEAANDDLRDQLRTTKRELSARIDALTEQLEEETEQHAEEKAKILKLDVLEAQLNATALEKCTALIKDLNGKLAHLKHVLRTPRLARMFQDLYQHVPGAE